MPGRAVAGLPAVVDHVPIRLPVLRLRPPVHPGRQGPHLPHSRPRLQAAAL